MTRFSERVMPVLVLLLAAATRGQTQRQRFPAFDPERIFMMGDADLDGRLSLDEYRDFLRLASHEERGGDDRADVPTARRGSRRVPLAGGIS